ncbi:G2/mitotic-specific cyclin-B3 isoform 2-T2 [Thomomys bottae]
MKAQRSRKKTPRVDSKEDKRMHVTRGLCDILHWNPRYQMPVYWRQTQEDYGSSPAREKREENYQAKISFSPQRTIKKRSAFDDLTNAIQNQSIQLTKKANKEFVKYNSWNTCTLGVARNKRRKRKWSKLDVVPVVHPATLSNIMEKPLSLDTLSKSETSSTEEAFLIKNSFVSKEGCAVKEQTLTEKAVKKCTYNEEMSMFEKLLSSEEESDSEFSIEPMTFGKKAKIEDSFSTNNSLPLSEKTCTTDMNIYSMNPLMLQDTISNENVLTMEPMEQCLLWKPASLQEEHSIEREGSKLQKSLPLQKMIPSTVSSAFEMKSTTKGEDLITEPLCLKKDHTTEKKSTIEGKGSYSNKPLVFQDIGRPLTTEEFQKPSLLQKKKTTQGQISILKKPWSLETDLRDNSNTCLKQAMYKKKHTTTKTTHTKTLPVVKRKRCNTRRKTAGYKPLEIQEITPEDELYNKAPVFWKSSTEKDDRFQKSFVSQRKYTNMENKVTSEKMFCLVKFPIKASYQQEALDLSKKCVLEEATPIQKPVPLKNPQPSTQGIVSYMKPLLLPTTTFGENSRTQEPFSFKKETVPLKNKMCTNSHYCQGLSDWKEMITEEIHSFFMKPPLKKKPKTEEEDLFQDSVAFQENTTLQGMPPSKKPCILQKTTTEKESHSKKPMVFLENPIIEKLYCQEPFLFDYKPDKEESCFLNTFNFLETDTNNDFLKKQPAFQKNPTIKDLPLNKPFIWNRVPTAEAATSLQGQLALKNPTFQEQEILKKQLPLCEYTNDESLSEPLDLSVSASKLATKMKPYDLQKPSTEKPVFKKPLILRKQSANMNHAVVEHITDTGAQLNKPLPLEDKSNNEKEAPLNEPVALDKKPVPEKGDIPPKPLVFQKSISDKRVLFQEALAKGKKIATQKQSSLKQPLALGNNSAHKENTFLKKLIPEVKNSSCASSNDFSSKASISDTVYVSNAAKPNITSNASTCELNSKQPFSFQNNKSWQKKSELEAIEEDNNDSFLSLEYAEDIFAYLKEREEIFILTNYMDKQTDLSCDMRALLVDWLVEVQMNFEMRHETLYLAVKLVDHYLTLSLCKKENLQLLGSTAFFIAAKFEEPYPPSLKEFLYICEDLYQRRDMLDMEASVLTTLDYDINIPIPYHFLRRYAMCLQSSMTTLTLSRYICEITLQESHYIPERASKLAAGSFLLALCMKNLGHLIRSLERHSGYTVSDLYCLVRKLNVLVTLQPYCEFKTVYNKYSSEVYYEVAKIGPLKMSDLEEMLHTD